MAQPKVLSYNQMDGCIDDSPLKSTVLNIGSESYQLAKYLSKHLSPLPQSNYTNRAHISSNQSLLVKELEHLKNVFHEKNGCLLWVIN